MMGSGKSTVGRSLAEKLTVSFHDLDNMIEEETGMTIPDIFSSQGEEYFRKLERSILIRESQRVEGVMALGGGSLQNQHIVDHLKVCGWLVFLDVDPSVLLKRVGGDSGRPMLKKSGPEDRAGENFRALLEERRPLYEQAEITVFASELEPAGVADKIINKLAIYDGLHSH